MIIWRNNLYEEICSRHELRLVRFCHKLTEFYPCLFLCLALHLLGNKRFTLQNPQIQYQVILILRLRWPCQKNKRLQQIRVNSARTALSRSHTEHSSAAETDLIGNVLHSFIGHFNLAQSANHCHFDKDLLSSYEEGVFKQYFTENENFKCTRW